MPSLGYFFTDGYQRSFPTEIWVGIIGTWYWRSSSISSSSASVAS
ncbi:ABC transporter-associated permease [Cutibacterium acnes JCM 18918]|nr:ABC transporter-associated permease [Cutibacterium acnes JCM 18918]